MLKNVIEVPGVAAADFPFNPAIRVGRLVFVSGQASVNDAGEIVAGTLEAEMRRSFDNVSKILAAAGLGLKHVVQVRSYVSDRNLVDEYNRVYRTIFSHPFPARTTLYGCLEPGITYEVDVIADAECCLPN